MILVELKGTRMKLKKTVIVTGCSSGIGQSIANYLLSKKIRVIGLSRDHKKANIKNNLFKPYDIDISNIKNFSYVLDEIFKEFSNITAVISNAGYGHFGNLENLSTQNISNYFNLNLLAHIILAKKSIPILKKQNSSHIIFMGSESALKGGKKGSVYSACKFALRGFSESLREECSSSGIKVTIINPGMTRTPFFKNLSFSPGNDQSNAIEPIEIAKLVNFILESDKNMVYEEINMAPKKKNIIFK